MESEIRENHQVFRRVQMFGRMVGETIRFAQKRLTGDKEEWWRSATNRAQVREAIIDLIEAQLNKSDRWMRPPPELEAQIDEWIAAIPET
jgi:non-homologous end joining protein Ku